MKRTNKKGFTIVELVIVIAVIAILAAVLIPTYSSLVKKANESKDTQLVRNLNTAIKIEGGAQTSFTTAHEAIEAANKGGFDLPKIAASQEGNYIVWDAEKQCFAYLKGTELVYAPDTDTSKTTSKTNLWKITDKVEGEYSIYYTGEATEISNLTVGFDAGYTNVSSITYTGTAAGVVIRTNGGTLTVNNGQADVKHYGNAQTVTITAAAEESYHEYGVVNNMTVTKGHVVFHKDSIVSSLTANGGTFKKEGGIVLSVSGTQANNIQSSDEDKKAFALEISNAAELASFRDSVNSGMSYEGLTVKLTADIDLSGYANWNPIGNRYTLNGDKIVDFDDTDNAAVRRIFMGTFDGQGHTISGMNINSLATNYPGLRSWKQEADKGDPTKSSYAALFGYISDATLKNFTLSGSVVGVDVAGVVGITGGDCTIDGVTCNVTLTGKNGTNEDNYVRGKVAAFVCCPKGTALTIKNCINNGDISSTLTTENKSNPVGGFVGYLDRGSLTLENCTNNGDITADSEAVGGLVGIVQYSVKDPAWQEGWNVIIKNCKNTGNLNSHHTGAIVGMLGRNVGTVTIKDCTNSGTITKDSSVTYNTDENVGFYYGVTVSDGVYSITKS